MIFQTRVCPVAANTRIDASRNRSTRLSASARTPPLGLPRSSLKPPYEAFPFTEPPTATDFIHFPASSLMFVRGPRELLVVLATSALPTTAPLPALRTFAGFIASLHTPETI